jgi:hypothetical protein
VKRWKNGKMVQRWVAAGLLEAESRFRRIKGYRDMVLLKNEIRRLTTKKMICTQKGVKSGQIQRNPTPRKLHGDRDKFVEAGTGF